MDHTEDRSTIKELSERLVAAQQPIRVLDAVAWDDSLRRAFFASDCEKLPDVDAGYYASRPLRFEPDALRREFEVLERDVESQLGGGPAGQILGRMVREYGLVIELLQARGTPRFATLSGELFGRADAPILPGQPSLVQLGASLDATLNAIDTNAYTEPDSKDLPSDRAVEVLQQSLDRSMADTELRVRVGVDDGIVADASAGSDYIKLRANTHFSRRELALLEAHEGWVHVGTTLNGRAQPVCSFLAKGTPATSVTQEGLAVLVEVTSLRSHPARLRRIADRIHAVHAAEQGADFVECFRRLCDAGRSREEAWSVSARVYRGGSARCGPFSKDLSYAKGFVLIYNFLRLAVRRGRLDRIPLLFVGKVVLEEIGLLADLAESGAVAMPRFLPPVFADPPALVSWLAYSNFMNQMNLKSLEASFAELLD